MSHVSTNAKVVGGTWTQASKLHQNQLLILFSMAQVICDLAFLNAYSSKSLKQKNSEKIVFLEKVFLYIFCFRTSPHNDAFQTYSAKSTKNPKMQVI
jgi:hypothetical protein